MYFWIRQYKAYCWESVFLERVCFGENTLLGRIYSKGIFGESYGIFWGKESETFSIFWEKMPKLLAYFEENTPKLWVYFREQM